MPTSRGNYRSLTSDLLLFQRSLERSWKHDRAKECMGRRKHEEAFRSWYTNKDTKKMRALPLNIAWGIWLARNLKLLKDRRPYPLNVQFSL
jgi:hypothetical protein